jgi:hypothetical protein
MKFTIDLDEDQMIEIFSTFVKQQDNSDPINSLSLIFCRYEGGDIYEPALFFYPDWDIDFEVNVGLVDALEEFLAEHDETDSEFADQCDLAKRLLATTDEWIKQQRSKASEKV